VRSRDEGFQSWVVLYKKEGRSACSSVKPPTQESVKIVELGVSR
jgi:hypothetical protein